MSSLSWLMDCELELDKKQKDLEGRKKGLFDEVPQIPGLIRVEAITVVRKLISNESSLFIFIE